MKIHWAKKLGNMEETVMSFVVGAAGTVSKNIKRRQGKLKIQLRIPILQTTALKLVRILRRVLETGGD